MNQLRRIAAFATLCTLASTAVAQDRPNIVLVFMDNFGWGEPGFNGGGVIRGAPTPRMDQLADEGMRLTNFNVEVQCTPSRSALMTGRYAIRSGNAKVPIGGGVYGMVQWEVTIAELLAAKGYATGMFGKWHLGHTPGRYPTDQGFDEWYGVANSTDESAWTSLDGFAESGMAPAHVYEGKKGNGVKKARVYDLEYRPLIDADLTSRGLDFMRRSAAAKKPFFLYMPYTATHFPTMPHPDFKGKTGNGPWADLLHQIDTYVGMLIDETEKLGIADDTIFIFTADNGPESAPKNQDNLTVSGSIPGTAGPWRGTLFTGFEGGLRVPFAMRWPGKIKPGSVSDEIVHAMDLMPTLAAFTGTELPADRVIDGVDQSRFLLGQQDMSNREGFVVYMGDKVFGVKWRNWKLHFNELETWSGVTRSYEMPRLYNLLVDPGETENVLFPHTWVPKKALALLQDHVVSLREHPPIKMGQPDPYAPPKD